MNDLAVVRVVAGARVDVHASIRLGLQTEALTEACPALALPQEVVQVVVGHRSDVHLHQRARSENVPPAGEASQAATKRASRSHRCLSGENLL